jgi:hypothetical protein
VILQAIFGAAWYAVFRLQVNTRAGLNSFQRSPFQGLGFYCALPGSVAFIARGKLSISHHPTRNSASRRLLPIVIYATVNALRRD